MVYTFLQTQKGFSHIPKSDKKMNTCIFSEVFEKCHEICVDETWTWTPETVSKELLSEAEDELSRMNHEQFRNPNLMNWGSMIEEQTWEIQALRHFLKKERNICC